MTVRLLELFMLILICGCTNTNIEKVYSENNEITFSVEVENSIITKTPNALTGNETFGVYAYLSSSPYFENVALRNSNGIWMPENKYYYPLEAFDMTLYAYGKNRDQNRPTHVSVNGVEYEQYSVENQDTQEERSVYENFLITKTPTFVNAGTKGAVSLRFCHALSRIRFSAQIEDNAEFSNIRTRIKSIQIETSGTGSLHYKNEANGGWTPGAKVLKKIPLLASASDIGTNKTNLTDYFYVIPLTPGSKDINTITVEVELLQRSGKPGIPDMLIGTTHKSISATSAQLAMNKSTKFNLLIQHTLTKGLTEIRFNDPVIEEWNNTGGIPQAKARPFITSTFIQSWLFLGWSEQRWREELDKLLSVGINEIIIDQSIYYYGSHSNAQYISTFPITREELGVTNSAIRMNTNTALEYCLRTCEAKGVKVYIGLNYDSRHWGRTAMSASDLKTDMQIGNKVMDKIIQLYSEAYPHALAGFYWGWEVNNVDFQPAANKALLIELLNMTLNHRNNLAKSYPVYLSPFMNKNYGMTAAQYGDFWKDVLRSTTFRKGDYLLPQDCMGTYLTLADQPLWMRAIEKAAHESGNISFGVNVETFDNQSRAASVNRVISQLKEASKTASKITSFSYTHFYSGDQQKHEAYKAYYLNNSYNY